MKKNWNTHILTFCREWVWPALVAILVATSIKSAIADWNIVPTGSMKPTILEGDRIFVNKLAYDLKIPYTTMPISSWQNPQRGDIVVFFSPYTDQRMVKRIIGLPGDTITMHENRLLINGQPVEYHAIAQYPEKLGTFQLEEDLGNGSHAILIDRPNLISQHSFTSKKIPDEHYFVMGDNRDDSKDSRYFGFVKRSRIVGRATAIVMSLEPENFYRPRWDRFFSSLR